jgi:hypothetical protein
MLLPTHARAATAAVRERERERAEARARALPWSARVVDRPQRFPLSRAETGRFIAKAAIGRNRVEAGLVVGARAVGMAAGTATGIAGGIKGLRKNALRGPELLPQRGKPSLFPTVYVRA